MLICTLFLSFCGFTLRFKSPNGTRSFIPSLRIVASRPFMETISPFTFPNFAHSPTSKFSFAFSNFGIFIFFFISFAVFMALCLSFWFSNVMDFFAIFMAL